MSRARGPVAILGVLGLTSIAVAFVMGGTRAEGEARGAVIEVTPASVSPGDDVRVALSGWPQGVVTANACGNGARRGSTDCDQIGGGSIRVGPSGSETIDATVLAPPVGCPCVIRAATTTGDVVRTAPIDIEGVPGGVDIAPTGQLPDASMLQVRAEVRGADVGWPRSWYPAFAGPTDRVLVLSVHNSSSGVVTGLRVVGSVGHDKTEGEPINQTLGAVPANTTRQFRVPFVIGAPVWGDYTVHGSIYGLAAPVNFSVPMSNEPWGIELAVPIFLLAVAQLLRRRERAQRRAEEAQAAASEEAEPALFPESSPSLGDYDLGAFGGPAYDRPRPEPTAAATAAGGELVDLGQHS